MFHILDSSDIFLFGAARHLLLLFFLLHHMECMWDLSSPTRDGAPTPWSGSPDSYYPIREVSSNLILELMDFIICKLGIKSWLNSSFVLVRMIHRFISYYVIPGNNTTGCDEMFNHLGKIMTIRSYKWSMIRVFFCFCHFL